MIQFATILILLMKYFIFLIKQFFNFQFLRNELGLLYVEGNFKQNFNVFRLRYIRRNKEYKKTLDEYKKENLILMEELNNFKNLTEDLRDCDAVSFFDYNLDAY